MSPALNVVFCLCYFYGNKKLGFIKRNLPLSNLRMLLSLLSGAKETRDINLHILFDTRGPAQLSSRISDRETVRGMTVWNWASSLKRTWWSLANWPLQPEKEVPEVTSVRNQNFCQGSIFRDPTHWDHRHSSSWTSVWMALKSEECSQAASNYQRPDFHQSVGGLFKRSLS